MGLATVGGRGMRDFLPAALASLTAAAAASREASR